MSEIKKPLPKKPGKPEEVKVVVRAAPPLKRAVPKPDAEVPAKPGAHKPAAPPAAAAKPSATTGSAPVVKAAPPLKPAATTRSAAPTGSAVPPGETGGGPCAAPRKTLRDNRVAAAAPKPSARPGLRRFPIRRQANRLPRLRPRLRLPNPPSRLLRQDPRLPRRRPRRPGRPGPDIRRPPDPGLRARPGPPRLRLRLRGRLPTRIRPNTRPRRPSPRSRRGRRSPGRASCSAKAGSSKTRPTP